MVIFIAVRNKPLPKIIHRGKQNTLMKSIYNFIGYWAQHKI